MLGPGDRRPDDDGEGAGLDGGLRLDRRADPTFGDHWLAASRNGLDQRNVGRLRDGTLHVPGEGGADEVCAEARSSLRLGGGRNVGHGDPAVAVNRGEEVGGRGRAGIGRGVEGDDVGAGVCERVDIADGGADAHRRAGIIALDQADDRRCGSGAHRPDVVDPLDPDRRRTARECSEREADDDIGPVERSPYHRLAGNDQRSAEFVD